MTEKKRQGSLRRKGNKRVKSSTMYFYILAVILMIAILIVILVVSPFNPSDRGTTSPDPEKVQSASVPEFRKDGTLGFIRQEGEDTVTIDIEIVDSQAEISRGLMYRPHMPESSGMLFIFPREETRSFWMKNTYIPLDIIFLDTEMKIVTIQEHTQPLSTQAVPSYVPARYVIEVNAGFAGKYSITEGDRVAFDF